MLIFKSYFSYSGSLSYLFPLTVTKCGGFLCKWVTHLQAEVSAFQNGCIQ